MTPEQLKEAINEIHIANNVMYKELLQRILKLERDIDVKISNVFEHLERLEAWQGERDLER